MKETEKILNDRKKIWRNDVRKKMNEKNGRIRKKER